MLSFPHRYSQPLKIPSGFFLEVNEPPNPKDLNRLLFTCNLDTHPPRKLALALKKSDYNLSILNKETRKLFAFVRVTSDKGLNANLWDLAAEPGKYQEKFLAFLVNRVLRIIRQDMPGCSISVATPSIAIKALKNEGFLLDPGGIRTMGFKL